MRIEDRFCSKCSNRKFCPYLSKDIGYKCSGVESYSSGYADGVDEAVNSIASVICDEMCGLEQSERCRMRNTCKDFERIKNRVLEKAMSGIISKVSCIQCERTHGQL